MTEGSDEWHADPLRARTERTPDRLALVDATTDETWTYAEFDALVDGTTAELADVGVEPGDTAATLFDSRPLAVALPFASIRLGATLAPLNGALDGSTLGEQIDRLDPAVVICAEDTESTATANFDGPICSVDGPASEAIDRFEPTAGDAARGDRSADTVDRTDGDGNDTTLVAFTSGTTGRPKGVRLTVENLLASAVASAQRLGVVPRDHWFSPLSTYHVGGIAPFVRSTLYGTTAILQREFDAEQTATALAAYDATCVSLVPTMLARVLDAGWRPREDFRFVLLGGGPAPDSLLERCTDLGVPVCPTYGTTETASQVATATPGEAVDHPGTVGRPLHGAEVRIEETDESNDVSGVEAERVGELVVSGPMVSPGYLDPEATERAFVDGALQTGDLGYRDADGRLWIVGRADDVIVTGGENVQPGTVEAALRDHEAVEAVAVVGIPDEEWGERVVALVVVASDVAAADLREDVRGEVPDYAVPKAIAFAETLPRTPSGTVDRAAVRRQFE